MYKRQGWGSGRYGVLGAGATSQTVKPVKIADIDTAVQASIGGTSNTYHTYILKEDGRVSSLGYNEYGQLGNGTTNSSSAAQDVKNATDIVQVAGSQNGQFGVFVKKDGTVWTVGYNGYGQLGNGTADNKSVPIQAGTEGSNVLVVHEVTLASSIDDDTPMGKTGTYGGDNTVISNVTLRGDNGENKFDAFNISSTSVARKFNLNLGVDEEKRLTSSDILTFKSMNPEIATVDSAGNVRPAHKGNYGSTVILVEYNYNDLGVVNKFKGMIRVNVAPYLRCV